VTSNPWAGRLNAEIYDAFVRDNRIYAELNRALVERADLAAARRVLDLGCGAGATALAALAVLPARAELVGVDASESMVEVARTQVRDPRARFRVAPAAALETVVTGPFDRALSNAAYWQLGARARMLEGLGRLLEPGGLFVFNVPAERVEGEETSLHPFQAALARAIESADGQAFPATNVDRLSRDILTRRLDTAGFDLVSTDRLTYRGRQGELMDLMEIPAMIRPLTPGWSDEEREQVAVRARRAADPDEEVDVPWIYFVARRRG
jgi:SAM-dependent methyltransferase